MTSQLAADRRQAAAYAAVVLGVAYAVRMVADAGVGLHDLVWASPLGWVEELAPLTGARPLALVPIVGSTIVLALVAVDLSGRRDLGAGLLADRTAPGSHLGLLRGPVGLGARLVRPVALGWWAAVAVAGLLYGLVARSAASTVAGSSVHQVLSRLGATGSGAATVLGLCFLMLAVLLAFAAAGQVTAARSEESSGRVENLLTRPLGPASWLGGRVLVAAGLLVVGGPVGGLAAWLGATSQGAGVPLGDLLTAGVNLVPPAAVVLGVGTLALGLRPRSAAVVTYGYVTWSLLVVVVGGIGSSSRWLLDTSVFHQMSASPAVPVDWVSAGVMLAVGVTCVAGGLAAFAHRDLAGA